MTTTYFSCFIDFVNLYLYLIYVFRLISKTTMKNMRMILGKRPRVPTVYVLSRNMKKYQNFLSVHFQFLVVKVFNIFEQACFRNYRVHFGLPRIQTFFMRTTKTRIRLHECASWFEPSWDTDIRRYVILHCGSVYDHLVCLSQFIKTYKV